jgi:phosphate transport system substrate-binding protein
VIIAGCEENGAAEAHKAAGAEDAEDACMALRTDGVSIDIDGDYTETLARVDANKNGIGVFGLSFYQNNTDKLQVGTMGGVVPSVPSRSLRANIRCRVRSTSTSRTLTST